MPNGVADALHGCFEAHNRSVGFRLSLMRLPTRRMIGIYGRFRPHFGRSWVEGGFLKAAIPSRDPSVTNANGATSSATNHEPGERGPRMVRSVAEKSRLLRFPAGRSGPCENGETPLAPDPMPPDTKVAAK
jgi:hypothetical protein